MAKVTLKSFPKESTDKVAGIKQIRGLYGIGLKEAKEVIEEAQQGKEYAANAMGTPERIKDAIATLREQGAKLDVPGEDGRLRELLREAIKVAVDTDELETAHTLVPILMRLI